MHDHLSRIRVVLHRPRHPGNVGAAARAMKNMGLSRLHLVDPCDLRADAARWMAVSARDLLDRARVHPDLASAVADCTRVVGTIPPDRPRFRDLACTPRELAARLRRTDPAEEIALVFGPEDNGLSNLDLDLCHEFVTIPSDPRCPSLNLAQAVMVIAYEIRTAVPEAPPAGSGRRAADVRTLEGFHAHLEETLLAVGFLRPDNRVAMMRDLRRIFDRARLDEREVRILRGVLRQAGWAASQRSGGASGPAGP